MAPEPRVAAIASTTTAHKDINQIIAGSSEATSRERLNLEEEWLLPVGGLAFPEEPVTLERALGYDAVELFMQRGKRVKEDSIQRFKGLGEMNAEELRVTTMDQEHRVLGQVTLDDAAQADEIFSVLMGEDVESRRAFIQRNARDVRFLDI
jgi:DNA gyrase/topoisomerase IV subunit B